MGAAMNEHQSWHLSGPAAELYERFVARCIFGGWTPLLVDAANLAPGERVLDLACGTGIVARAAAERVGVAGHVIAVDFNPAMIAVARSLPPPNGAKIEWREGNAVDLPLKQDSVSVVLCQQGLQFFPNKLTALQEIHRVLDASGRLAASVWNSTGVYNRAVGDALARFVSREAAARFLISRQAPSGKELERLTTDAGFLDVDLRVSRIDVHLSRVEQFVLDHLSATPVAPVIAAVDRKLRTKIGANVRAQLEQYADGDGVTYPEETHVLTAHK
jgi:ubiquinone/menaquinone biosynthesis C-methylase UbiE